MVKTAHMHFPKDFLKDWYVEMDNAHQADPALNPRGEWITLTSSYRNPVDPNDNVDHPITAVGWADKVLKSIVCNFGTSYRSPTDSIRSRSRRETDVSTGQYINVEYNKVVKRPNIVAEYFDAFPTIDIHDHYRQGTLELERHWLTKTWWVRLFTTLYGVIIVNCFFLARLEYRSNPLNTGREQPPDFIDFAGKLAYALIFNPLIPRNIHAGRHRRSRDEDEYDGQVAENQTLVS
jgi:hypothetical protein